MNKVLLVSVFGGGLGNNRQNNILYRQRENTVLITSDFNHEKKRYKTKSEMENSICLHVPSYMKNLSLKRIYSHIIFAYHLKKFLDSLQQIPLTIYCAMPTSTAAYVCGKYCKKHKVRFVVDVIDLWPDSLLPIVVGIKGQLLKYFIYPWKYITVQAYKMADVILGESKQYADEAALYNNKASIYPLYLGVDRNEVNKLITNSTLALNRSNDEIWIGYAGSLGTSYDFETLVKGVASLNGKYQYKLFFIGDGVCRAKVENLINQYSVNAEITGFLKYGDLLKYLSYCDIAVNIFRDKTKVVHSYKFNDYVATNCFILNSLLGETADMVDRYKVGLNFDFKDNTFDKVLLQCLEFWDDYREWKLNNERLVDELLDKEAIYSQIETILSK
jgi:hypothetical protein|uniref:glycosyltransferase n=1 Tax=Bacteroides uniformis TaxID=820 RepID=UPI004026359B